VDLGLLLLRLTVGLTLAAHGAQKLFRWFGGSGLDGAGKGMEHLGFFPGRRHALMAGVTEAVGGLLLALGLFTPAAASIFVAVMLVAGVSAHGTRGFFLANGGYEYTLILGASALSVAFTGPGRMSLDALLGLHVGGVLWGAGAAAVGFAGGASQLVSRRRQSVRPRAAAA
jgi:putative oxidoreductase